MERQAESGMTYMCVNPRLVASAFWDMIGLFALFVVLYGLTTCGLDWIRFKRQVKAWEKRDDISQS